MKTNFKTGRTLEKPKNIIFKTGLVIEAIALNVFPYRNEQCFSFHTLPKEPSTFDIKEFSTLDISPLRNIFLSAISSNFVL